MALSTLLMRTVSTATEHECTFNTHMPSFFKVQLQISNLRITKQKVTLEIKMANVNIYIGTDRFKTKMANVTWR